MDKNSPASMLHENTRINLNEKLEKLIFNCVGTFENSQSNTKLDGALGNLIDSLRLIKRE